MVDYLVDYLLSILSAYTADDFGGIEPNNWWPWHGMKTVVNVLKNSGVIEIPELGEIVLVSSIGMDYIKTKHPNILKSYQDWMSDRPRWFTDKKHRWYEYIE